MLSLCIIINVLFIIYLFYSTFISVVLIPQYGRIRSNWFYRTFFYYFCSVGNETIAVPFRGPPRYNPKRRSGAWGGWWTAGDRSSLASSTRIPADLDAILRRPQLSTNSPCSLERPFSSASSSISDASHPSHEDDASILTGIPLRPHRPYTRVTNNHHHAPTIHRCMFCVHVNNRCFTVRLFASFLSNFYRVPSLW